MACARPGCTNEDAPQACWLCEGDLCWQHWEELGVCCPEGDAAQIELLLAETHEERAAIMARGGRPWCDHVEH